jgi:hypothetical protein
VSALGASVGNSPGSSAASVREEAVERPANSWLFNPRPVQNEHQVRDI